MPIDLYLTKAEARKLLTAIKDDYKMSDVAERITALLGEHEPKAPWRKVTGRGWSPMGHSYYLTLQCGHRKAYSGDEATFRAASYKKVRCEDCQ